MKKRNALEKSEYINRRYKDYLKSSFAFGNDELQKLFEEQLDKEELFKGPFVDLSLPFERGKSINSLIEEGVLCKSFKKLSGIPFDRPLYYHQQEAINILGAGRSAIITTGTGSGKTESFLYPILNEILSDIEKGMNDVGIRAIFLYPMNALVNDQIDRVRELLRNCPEVKYGFFTGETEEKASTLSRKKYEEQNGVEIPENEMIFREEIRKEPPHLLFTNYSMLEYLLIRPNDYAIFTPQRLKNWKYVVLDEAHSYSGALGIELSLLMRRLTGLADNKPRFILTSATLGQQGKSEQDIVDFAKKLTSAEYSQKDIVFSKRIPLYSKQIQYSIDPEDYIIIKQNCNDIEKLKIIAKNYFIGSEDNAKAILFDLLERDRNVHEIYTLLRDGCKSFVMIKNELELSFSVEELSALIDLINMAEKNGIGLFDLKYHSFVRPLSGAYITLTKPIQLSLKKTNEINGMKAFELGNCRYCNSPYIIGKKIYNQADGLYYLLQNNEVDIYENYGENENVNIDFFLLENSAMEEEAADKEERDTLEEQSVCAKCGVVYESMNLNAKKCLCEEGYKKIIYRVIPKKKKDEIQVHNNINGCPCCGHRSNSGIVRGLNVGKDEGTAIVSQMLYNAIDVDVDDSGKKKQGGLSLKLGAHNKAEMEKAKKNKVKQFLSFSDSRQQASFSAVFFDEAHKRMLKKRLIWQVIEQQGYKEIGIDQLASLLEQNIRQYDLFKDRTLAPNEAKMSANKNAWATILADLLKVDGNYDGEGLGLYYFDLELSDVMKNFSDNDVDEELGQYNIHTKDELETLMQVVLGIFQTTPAINYSVSALTPEEKRDCLGYQQYDIYVMYNCPKTMVGVRSFLPVKSKDNMVVRYVMKVCSCDEDVAKQILDLIFNQLAVPVGMIEGNEAFLIKHSQKEAYQMNVSRYVLKNYKSSKYYQCCTCGRLTPYNLHGYCIQDKCDGRLKEVDPDVILENNYYRNEYKNKKIEQITIKEHTAQIERKKAKHYQNAFRDGKINILSCSTTFEMGIDLGSLETVFMRNVPPLPANYVQRAGRAGRGKDSSAYILTYCSTSSHDYTYFEEPEKMIRGVINPPSFNVLNKKIIVRHLMAASLGFFFRNYPDYFNSVESLVFGGGIKKFNEYLSEHPQNLNEYINERVIPEERYFEYRDFKWFDEMQGVDEKLQFFEQDIRKIIKEFEDAKKIAMNEERLKDADYYQRQIIFMKKQRVIDSLSRYCVIPKYGFPVDVVNLDVYDEKSGAYKPDVNLSRDLKIAVSEYAPDSEVVADGEKYTSKYIGLPKNHELPRSYFTTCPRCKKINVNISDLSNAKCKYCGESMVDASTEYFVEPIEGFKTGITKTSVSRKPKKSYAGEVSYIGGGKTEEDKFELGNLLKVESSINDELMVVNKSLFYMCPVCGYSDMYKGGVKTLERMVVHKNFRQFNCECSDLQSIRIGHRFKTDVVRFTLPSLSVENVEDAQATALSFLYAFLEGVSETMNIERNDIDGLIERNFDDGSYDVLLYDNVPGGAGHVKRIMNKESILKSLYAAREKVAQMCCDEETSCYNCLRNYYNQMFHSRLKRKLAREYIEGLIRDIETL